MMVLKTVGLFVVTALPNHRMLFALSVAAKRRSGLVCSFPRPSVLAAFSWLLTLHPKPPAACTPPTGRLHYVAWLALGVDDIRPTLWDVTWCRDLTHWNECHHVRATFCLAPSPPQEAPMKNENVSDHARRQPASSGDLIEIMFAREDGVPIDRVAVAERIDSRR